MSRILLVEDNDSNQDLIARYLRLFDHEVTVVGSGTAGLNAIRQDCKNLDLVLMDINVPEMDGLEVTRKLKADEATKSLPVIALTAHAMKGDREKALAAGCDDYATKPIDFGDLFKKIETLSTKNA